MSTIEAVTIPRWGMTMTEGTITQWLVAEGGSVERGQELIEIESSKVSNVIEAAASGKLRRIVLAEGVTAPVGALAGVIADSAVTDEEIEAFIASYASRLGSAEEGDPKAITPRLLNVNGSTINVLELGAGGDDAAVLLHGFGGDLSTWLFNQAALADKIQTIAVDLPGHGGSSPVAGHDVFAKIAEIVAAAIYSRVPGRIHLIGHSFGGAVAAVIAAKEPARVASLTLIAPIGLGERINREFLFDFVAAERRRPLLGVLERLFADPTKITSDMVEGTLRFKRLEGVQDALASIAASIANEAGQVQAIGGALAKLQCPVMLIWGDQDAIVPVPGPGDVPTNAELRVIREVGHMPQMEASAAVNEALLENIQRGR